MAQVTRRTIRYPWSTGIPEYVWLHQASIAAHNVTRQLPTRRATQVLRTGTESALGFRSSPESGLKSDITACPRCAAGVLGERYDEVDDIAKARRVPSLQLAGTPDRSTLDLNSLTEIGVKLVGRFGDIR